MRRAELDGIDRRKNAVAVALAASCASILAAATFAQDHALTRSESAHGNTFRRFAVAADVPAASDAGASILARGGTAADAAVATMLTLGVANPASSGLGGGGFALYYRASDRSFTFLDFRERAPAAAAPDMFAHAPADASESGGLAVAVPGEPAGIDALLARFGRLRRAQVFAPAIALARAGAPATHYLAVKSADREVAEPALRDPLLRTLYDARTGAIREGTRLRRPALVRTLQAFARTSSDLFYRGEIAQEIVAAVTRNGGTLSADDLRDYRVAVRAPLDGTRYGRRIVTAPAESAGGYILLASLGILERRAPTPASAVDSATAHLLAESWRTPFDDRAALFGDPDTVDVPTARLLTPTRLDALARGIDPARASRAASSDVGHAPRPRAAGGTSHLCVVDAEGNIAAVTTTVNLVLGARITAAGFVLNDEMDDFASATGAANGFGLRGGAPNLPGPGRRPVSSMAPTIVLDGDRPIACLGGSGGSRIPTAVTQVLLALLGGTDVHEAVAAPRIHHQGGDDPVELDPALATSLGPALAARGHVLAELPWPGAVVQAITMHGGSLVAASDPRKGGRPAGR